MELVSVGSPALWIGFTAFVLVLMAFDLGVFTREKKSLTIREAAIGTMGRIALALGFNVFVWWKFGNQHALEFSTGYLIELALSVDNLFVFLVIFQYFAVPPVLQHRVLFWGILAALILRALFIVVGAVMLQAFHWIIYIFGAFLIFTGGKLLFQKDEEMDPSTNPMLKLVRRFVPTISEYRDRAFFVRENGKLFATPLFVVLVVVEATDLVFATDSIPAIFAITTDPFLVYTSNIFAILGLRAMFFVLQGMMGKFHYLKLGLAFVLVFIGAKMVVDAWYHVPIAVSLVVVAGMIGLSVVASVVRPPDTAAANNADGPPALDEED